MQACLHTHAPTDRFCFRCAHGSLDDPSPPYYTPPLPMPAASRSWASPSSMTSWWVETPSVLNHASLVSGNIGTAAFLMILRPFGALNPLGVQPSTHSFLACKPTNQLTSQDQVEKPVNTVVGICNTINGEHWTLFSLNLPAGHHCMHHAPGTLH